MLGEVWWLLSLLGCFWCLYTPSVSDQRLLLVYFLSFVIVIHLYTLCFEISALGLFYLGSLIGCYLRVVVGSGGFRVIYCFHISFIFKKYKNIFAFSYLCISCILHWHGSCIRFACWFIVKFSSRNDCTYIWRKNFASHVVAYHVLHSTHCTWHCLLGVHIYFTTES